MKSLDKTWGFHLWNPWLYSGVPSFAEMKGGIFYPPNWIFYVAPTNKGIVLFMMFHYFLAGLLAYIFLRRLDMDSLSSLGGGVFYAFFGFIIINGYDLSLLSSYSLIPLTIIAVHNLIRRGNLHSALLLSFSFALIILAGSVPVLFISLMVSLLYFMGHLSIQDFSRPSQMKLVGFFFISLFLALLLSAIQLAPAMELFYRSGLEGGYEYKDLVSRSLGFSDLVYFIIPDFSAEGSYPLTSVFVGIFPLLLTLATPVLSPAREKRHLLIFGIMILLGFLLSLGETTPLYPLFCHVIPLVRLIKYPSTFMILSGVGMMFFIALTVEQFYEIPGRANYRARDILTGIIVVIAILIVALTVSYIKDGQPQMGLIYFIATGVGGILLVFMSMYGFPGEKAFKFLCVLFMIISSFSAGMNMRQTLEGDYFARKGETFKGKPSYRILYEKEKGSNLPLVFSLGNISGENPTALADYVRYIRFNDGVEMVTPTDMKKIAYKNNLLGVNNYTGRLFKFLSPEGIYKSEIRDNKENITFTGVKSFPRVFIAGEHVVIPDLREALRTLNSSDFRYNNTLIFGEEPYITPSKTTMKYDENLQVAEKCSIVEYKPDKIMISVTPVKESWLFVGETYYPGWEAYVSGHKRKVFRVNGIFRAVRLYPGDNMVEMRFRPLSLKIGSLITALTLLLCTIVWWRAKN